MVFFGKNAMVETQGHSELLGLESILVYYTLKSIWGYPYGWNFHRGCGVDPNTMNQQNRIQDSV